MALILSDENFEKEIQNAEKPVLVDFYAVWCPPCSLLSPILEKLEEEFNDKIIFARINSDIAPLISKKFEINQIPTVILFQNGKPINRFIGLKPEADIRQWLEENFKNDSEKIIKESEEYARKNGFKLNPDKKTIERIARGLLANEKKYGFRYCPCRRVTENPEEDKKIICPCQFMHYEIEKDGHCLCGLFVK